VNAGTHALRTKLCARTQFTPAAWWNETVCYPHLDAAQNVVAERISLPNHVFASMLVALCLAVGSCRLFRDNVMFDAGKLTGFLFYFAGNDKWLFDLAVALNDSWLNADQSGVNGLFNDKILHFMRP
jgi:homoserine kinase type II